MVLSCSCHLLRSTQGSALSIQLFPPPQGAGTALLFHPAPPPTGLLSWKSSSPNSASAKVFLLGPQLDRLFLPTNAFPQVKLKGALDLTLGFRFYPMPSIHLAFSRGQSCFSLRQPLLTTVVPILRKGEGDEIQQNPSAYSVLLAAAVDFHPGK